jgi:hypothetical protein
MRALRADSFAGRLVLALSRRTSKSIHQSHGQHASGTRLVGLVNQDTPEGRAITAILNCHASEPQRYTVNPQLYGEGRCLRCASGWQTPLGEWCPNPDQVPLPASQNVLYDGSVHVHHELTLCVCCRDDDGDALEWPCPTVRVIAKALGITTEVIT